MHVARKGFAALFVALLAIGAPAAYAASAPDATRTPGDTNPAVTQVTIAITVCKSGYTKTVRSVSASTKRRVYFTYHVAKKDQAKYTIDHLIPLEIGGGNSVANLWPERDKAAKKKDVLEGRLHRQLCAGTITLAQAQTQTFFLHAAQYGDLPLSPHFRKTRPGSGAPGAPRKRAPKRKPQETPVDPSTKIAPPVGDTYRLTLRSGGEVALTVNASHFALSRERDDRDFVNGLIDAMTDYGDVKMTAADETPADEPESDA